MSELICNFGFSEQPFQIPDWALKYLLTMPLQIILRRAAVRTENDIIPLDAKFCSLPRLDISRIVRRRWIRDTDDAHHLMVLSLYLDETSSVVPFIMIEASYTSTLTNSVTGRDCFIEAQWPPRLDENERAVSIRSACTLFAIDKESGQRLHLRSRLLDVRLSGLFPTDSSVEEAPRRIQDQRRRFNSHYVPLNREPRFSNKNQG